MSPGENTDGSSSSVGSPGVFGIGEDLVTLQNMAVFEKIVDADPFLFDPSFNIGIADQQRMRFASMAHDEMSPAFAFPDFDDFDPLDVPQHVCEEPAPEEIRIVIEDRREE